MSTIAGLDLSLTSAGIAILVDGRPKVITSVGHKGRDGDDWQHRSRRVRSQVQAVIAAMGPICNHRGSATCVHHRDATCSGHVPDLAVIEGPSYASQYGDAFDRAALWHGVYGALEARRVSIVVIAPKTLKLWFTGSGDASKADMTNAAMGRFREPISTTDEADAVALATAGAYRLGDPIPWEPCQRSIDCLERVDWPVGAV